MGTLEPASAFGQALNDSIRRMALTAKSLVAANGVVVYSIGQGGRLDQLLWSEEDERRCQAYFSDFHRDDPLAPEHCFQADCRIVWLNERMADNSLACRRYFAEFMCPFGLVDAAEMFLPGAGALPTLGFSLLRNAQFPTFTAGELAALDTFHGLADRMYRMLAAAEIREPRQHLGHRFPVLTSRELDVAAGIVDGLSNKLIARQENMALPTVKTHIQNIYRKCGVSSRSELVRLAC